MTDSVSPALIPCTDEALQRIIGNPDGPDADPGACDLCRSIPHTCRLLHIPSRDASYGGYPAAFARLHDLVVVSYFRTVKRCPECGGLYLDEYHSEYLAGGSEDEYTLTRLSRREALALLEGQGAPHLLWREGRWELAWG
ncbi:MAG: hypothetical protein GX605_09930 [Chloroflexi bacterium]|nr:hypothetical protein [Chloroflexota bacterium]